MVSNIAITILKTYPDNIKYIKEWVSSPSIVFGNPSTTKCVIIITAALSTS